MKLLALLLLCAALAANIIGLIGAPFTVIYCLAMLVFSIGIVCHAARSPRK